MAHLPASDRAAIAHLDYQPSCEGRKGGCGNPAETTIDQHGCSVFLLCRECLNLEMERCREYVRPRCTVCDQSYLSVGDMITVAPL